MDGKAEALFCRHRCSRRHARRGPAEGARRDARAAADPQGHELPARRRLDQRELRAPGARPRRAARRRRRALLRARPCCRPRDAGPSLRSARADRSSCATPTAMPSSCSSEGAVIASFAARRAETRQPAASGGGARRSGADRRRRAARRSDRARRAAQRAAVPIRAAVPGRAAGMPDPDDEGEPEVLPAARLRRRARLDPPLPRRQQHPPGRPEPRDRRQRARRAPAAGRRQVLLRPGPQEDARVARAAAGQGGLSRQARHAGRARRARARDRRARSASGSAARRWQRAPSRPRCSPRPTC